MDINSVSLSLRDGNVKLQNVMLKSMDFLFLFPSNGIKRKQIMNKKSKLLVRCTRLWLEWHIKRVFKSTSSGKVSAFYFRLFNWIHRSLFSTLFYHSHCPLFSIMQTHSLISNSERWLYLKTTETDDQRLGRPWRNLEENKMIEEDRRR